MFGSGKLRELADVDKNSAQTSVDYVIDHLPPNGMYTADIQAFRLAWESLHNGEELFKNRVRPKTTS